jgi:hypothetical protein
MNFVLRMPCIALLLSVVLSLQSCHAESPQLGRGGGGPRLFGPMGVRKPGSQSQRQQHQRLYPIVEDLTKDDDENQETKNMINAFLTREDRNTFIGKLPRRVVIVAR